MKNFVFPRQLAREAVLLNRYTDAVELLKPLSAAGDPDAQFLHSYLHFWDDNLPRTDAVAQMLRAAERGHVEANYVLAVCPDLVPGYTFQLPTGEPYLGRLRLAADRGSVNAQTDLAHCYLEGVGVGENLRRARKLLEQAYRLQMRARQPVPKTCLLLARMLLDGVGGDQRIGDGLLALRRCEVGFGDPFADEAISLCIDITERGLYDTASEHRRKDSPELRSTLDSIRANPSTVWQRYLKRYCATTLHYDLRTATFDEFVGFVFEHFPQPRENSQYADLRRVASVAYDARLMLRHYTQLFSEPGFLLERYTSAEIERGLDLDGIRRSANWSLGCVLAHAHIRLDEEEACIRSMYPLFEKLFARVDMDDIAFMWWDWGYGTCGTRRSPRRQLGETDRLRLNQATFETIAMVLQINSPVCQSTAIHALGHSSYPEKEIVLRKYLEDHPDLSAGDREYVMNAIVGKIL